jgi:hypothetical protein
MMSLVLNDSWQRMPNDNISSTGNATLLMNA